MAKGWGSPPPPRRERRTAALPEGETPKSLVTEEEGDMEFEVQFEARRRRSRGAGRAVRNAFSFLLSPSPFFLCLAVWGEGISEL